jgi:hypothetical protein
LEPGNEVRGVSGRRPSLRSRTRTETGGRRVRAVPNEGESRDAGGSLAAHLTDKGITAIDIAKMLGVSRATVHRYLARGLPRVTVVPGFRHYGYVTTVVRAALRNSTLLNIR